jgi:uridine kinase
MKNKYLIPIYILFFLIRFVLIISFYPEIHENLFIPFISNALKMTSLDIWQSWISLNGRSDAFPYGIGMALPLAIPIFVISKFLSISSELTHLIFGGILFLIDFLALMMIIKVTKNYKSALLYAFSPLAIYITYYHGQLDLIPSVLFLSTLILLKSRKMLLAGIFLGITISAKLSFILIIPFLVIFYLNNLRARNSLNKMTLGFIMTVLILQIPLFFSYGYQKMVLETPEATRIFYYAINLASTSTILIFPTAYVGLLLWLWRTGRTTDDVLISFFTSSLVAIGIFAPGAIGWLFWGMPLLALIAARKSLSFFALNIAFQILAIVTYANQHKGANLKVWDTDFAPFLLTKTPLIQSLLETAFFCLGILIIFSILRTAVSSGDIYGLNSKPISLAIAGDSGVGKDTLTNNLVGIIGIQGTSVIYGDNYHRFERDSLKWKTFTHLNPEANDLNLLISDVRKSLRREPVSRRIYDHNTGKFTYPIRIKSKDFLIVNGLHSLSLGKIQKEIDLNIFLSMSDQLRIKLKIQRDLDQRNLSKEYVLNQMYRRNDDAIKHITSQIKYADLIFKISEVNSEIDEIGDLVLEVESYGLNFLQDLGYFIKLYSFCDLEFQAENAVSQKIIFKTNNIEPDVLNKIYEIMVPDKKQIFYEKSKITPDLQGIMTLVTILGVVEKRIGTREIIHE